MQALSARSSAVQIVYCAFLCPALSLSLRCGASQAPTDCRALSLLTRSALTPEQVHRSQAFKVQSHPSAGVSASPVASLCSSLTRSLSLRGESLAGGLLSLASLALASALSARMPRDFNPSPDSRRAQLPPLFACSHAPSCQPARAPQVPPECACQDRPVSPRALLALASLSLIVPQRRQHSRLALALTSLAQ